MFRAKVTAAPRPLALRPAGLRDALLYALGGRATFRRALRVVANLPDPLSPAARSAAQQSLSEHLLRHLRVKLDVDGLQHVVGNGPYVVVALHEGLVDVLCLLRLPLPLRFVARDEIFGWPDLGPAITRLGHVAIDPESGAGGYRRLLHAARAITAGGESVAIFPQGSVLGLETDFQRGAFALAHHLGLPLLPVVLTGTHRVWEHPFSPAVRYGQAVGLRVLPPISAATVAAVSPETLRVTTRRAMKHAAQDPRLPPARRYRPERDGFWDGYRFDIDPDFPDVHHLVTAHRQHLIGETA